MFILYECGICGSYHPWHFNGDCREDRMRFTSPEEYAKLYRVSVLTVEVRGWEERVAADKKIGLDKTGLIRIHNL